MNCKQCQSSFLVTDEDCKVYAKFDVPEPTLCPDCRMQRRMAFRNEMNFYKATCGKTGKSLITNISPGRGYTVYDSEVWFSDDWDPLQYGREYDFTKPFFKQMDALIKAVPHPNLATINCENSDYCNHSVRAKDCYLTSRIGDSERIYYSYLPINSFNSVDCYYIQKSEKCYEAIDCSECYNVTFSQRLKTCRNVHFSFDCIGCEDCFGCVGLRHKKYHFFNQPLSKEEYEKAVAQFNSGSHRFVTKMQNRFYQEEVIKRPQRSAVIENSENAIGNCIYNGRNIYKCFDVNDTEDARYGVGIQNSKDMMDVYTCYQAEECYESVGVASGQKIRFSHLPYNNCYDLEYCFECTNNTQHCFGCVGLKHKSYCILNKQYTEGEYSDLKAKIIEHMKSTEEYGEFFPIHLSNVPYNESVANEYYPLSKEEIEKKGLFWHEETRDSNTPHYDIPDDIKDVKDDILDAVLSCEKTGRPYKIIPQELKFYRQHSIPIPRLCPYQRHIARIQLRAPRKLWERECENCQAKIQTTYAPDRQEKVVCETCYLDQIY